MNKTTKMNSAAFQPPEAGAGAPATTIPACSGAEFGKVVVGGWLLEWLAAGGEHRS